MKTTLKHKKYYWLPLLLFFIGQPHVSASEIASSSETTLPKYCWEIQMVQKGEDNEWTSVNPAIKKNDKFVSLKQQGDLEETIKQRASSPEHQRELQNLQFVIEVTCIYRESKTLPPPTARLYIQIDEQMLFWDLYTSSSIKQLLSQGRVDLRGHAKDFKPQALIFSTEKSNKNKDILVMAFKSYKLLYIQNNYELYYNGYLDNGLRFFLSSGQCLIAEDLKPSLSKYEDTTPLNQGIDTSEDDDLEQLETTLSFNSHHPSPPKRHRDWNLLIACLFGTIGIFVGNYVSSRTAGTLEGLLIELVYILVGMGVYLATRDEACALWCWFILLYMKYGPDCLLDKRKTTF
ncbi:MAG: hypothetical protein ACPGC9_00970 [Cytophagales bacterium]